MGKKEKEKRGGDFFPVVLRFRRRLGLASPPPHPFLVGREEEREREGERREVIRTRGWGWGDGG